jgi:4-amino-4-deoxy-L-arabinose transferase-like glycosyltransferase
MSETAIGRFMAHGRSATRALLFIMAAQILLWTLLPALTFVTAPLDVVENIAWGEQWQLGYYKHPPLQAWLTGVLYQPAGAVWPIYLLSQLSIAVCFLSIWALGRDVVDERGQLLAVAFFSLIYYANIPTPEFNANVLQMPIWAVAPLLLWRAINSVRIGWWLALGVVMALSVYSKYSAVLLVPVLAAAALSVPQGRAALLTPGPYIGAALAAVLVAPQMWWLVQHDFIPFAWAQGRSEHLVGLSRLTGTAKFLGAQIADHGAALLVIAVSATGRGAWRQQNRQNYSHADRYVLVTAFAPIALATASSVFLGTGLRDMWATPFFAYTGLAAAIWLRPHFDRLRWRNMAAIWAALFVLAPIGVGLAPVLGPVFHAKPARVAMDGVELARQAEKLWLEKTGRRLAIVAGPTWEAGIVASYAPSRPAFFVDGEIPKNPWITPEKLAIEGTLILWPGAEGSQPPASLGALAPISERGTFSIPYRYGDRRASVVWAIVPPKSSAKGGVQ